MTASPEGPAPAGPLTRAAAALGRAGAGLASPLIARAWGRALLLALVCAAAFLPGLSALPVTDRDEGRFVQASRQMIESGDWIDIRFQDEPRWKKPAGIYWMQAAAVSTFGAPTAERLWAFRLPSLIGAVLTVFGAAWALSPLLGASAATLAAGFTGLSVILAAEANIAKTDGMLNGMTVIAMGAWIRRLTGAGLLGAAPAETPPGARPPQALALALILWIALAVTVLLKGPIGVMVLALAALALALLERSRAPLAALGLATPGPLVFLALALPWYVAIHLATDGAFWDEALFNDLLGKVAGNQPAHGAPPGTYLGVMWGTFWPWAPLMILAAPAVWAARRSRPALLLLCWAIPTWLVFELTPTKLPHYVLPAVPALTGLVAWWWTTQATEPRRWQTGLAALLFALVGVALGLAGLALPLALGLAPSIPAALLGLAAAALALLGQAALRAGDRQGLLTSGALSAACIYASVLQFGLPSLTFAFPSVPMAAASAPFAECAGRPAASQSYREPSLVFLQGTGTRLMSVEEAAEALRAEPGALVWLEDRRRDRTLDLLGPDAPALETLAEVTAFNPNRGRVTTLRLTARQGDPILAPCR
ncbi:MAG: glycosyltransferase family 39 protein [Pseudomonadota bacterium]